MKRAISFWNGRVDEIQRSIAHSGDKLKTHFKWSQLVWQEIKMYIFMDRLVEDDDLRWICQRRGFTRHQRRFLKQALCHVGLRKDK